MILQAYFNIVNDSEDEPNVRDIQADLAQMNPEGHDKPIIEEEAGDESS